MSIPPLSRRLAAAASLVREGAYLADIGTDHGYLAIHLLASGKIREAVLSDINEGPLSKARANVKAAGVAELAHTVLSDGAAGLSHYPVTDFAVLGMGGELIASIVEAAPCMKKEGVRLILGPMSRPGELRESLFSLGYAIRRELYVTDSGRHYVTLVAEYTGVPVPHTAEDAAIGMAEHFASPTPEMLDYLRARVRSLDRIIQGKESCGASAADERRLLLVIKERTRGLL